MLEHQRWIFSRRPNQVSNAESVWFQYTHSYRINLKSFRPIRSPVEIQTSIFLTPASLYSIRSIVFIILIVFSHSFFFNFLNTKWNLSYKYFKSQLTLSWLRIGIAKKGPFKVLSDYLFIRIQLLIAGS